MKHVSTLSSSSDHLGWSFGPSLGNKILPLNLLPVTPTFGPGLDLGVSVSMRPPTAADKLSNLALEIRSGGVDGILSVLFTLLPSRNHLLLLLTLPEGRVVDPRSLFLTPVSAAMITPGRRRAQYSFCKYIACTSHTTSKQFEIHHRLMQPRVSVLNGNAVVK